MQEVRRMKYIKFKDRVLISGMLKDGISIRDISELAGYSQSTILYEINGAKSKDQYDPLRKQLLKKYSQSLRLRILMQEMAKDGIANASIAKLIQNNRDLVGYEFKRYGSKEHYNAYKAQLTI